MDAQDLRVKMLVGVSVFPVRLLTPTAAEVGAELRQGNPQQARQQANPFDRAYHACVIATKALYALGSRLAYHSGTSFLQGNPRVPTEPVG